MKLPVTATAPEQTDPPYANPPDVTTVANKLREEKYITQEAILAYRQKNFGRAIELVPLADIGEFDRYGFNLLHYAVSNNHVEGVKLMIGRVHLDVTTSAKYTALMIAARNDFTDMVRLLLEHGANPNILYANRYTAHSYARKNSATKEMLRQVTDHPDPKCLCVIN